MAEEFWCRECTKSFRFQADLKKHKTDDHPIASPSRVQNHVKAAVEKPGNIDMGFLNGGCIQFYVSPMMLKNSRGKRYVSPNQSPDVQDFKEERGDEEKEVSASLDLNSSVVVAQSERVIVVDESVLPCCLICSDDIEEPKEKIAREIRPCNHSMTVHDECLLQHIQVSTRCPVLI